MTAKLPITKLITSLQDNRQDFEFYPTTAEIIAAVVADLKDEKEERRYSRRGCSSILDIGAGNGKVLEALRAADLGLYDLYAIEKSPILCGQLDPSIFIIGTDFAEQSLLSKQVDVIFSNPPYSCFEEWAVKIIRQSAAPLVYLVIPVRWEDSVQIKAALEFRGATHTILGEFDFRAAEDRQARARVHLLKVRMSDEKDDAFDRFFAEQFAPLLTRFEAHKHPDSEETIPVYKKGGGRRRLFEGIPVTESYPQEMVALYLQEMSNIERNYQLVADLDAELLREFDVNPEKIISCLKQRLSGLRMDYWTELFSHMRAITDRLTSKSRKNLLDTLHQNVQVDFTVTNISAVLVWAVRNANRYIDTQLIATYGKMIEKANVFLYKSNRRAWVDNRWRYREEQTENTHFALEYRMVIHQVGGISYSPYSWEQRNGLTESAYEFIGDLLTIANNLGFLCSTSAHAHREWTSNGLQTFYFSTPKGQRDVLFEARAFKNGNIHLRLHQSFALALNVEHGRLKGWLNSADEAMTELNDVAAGIYFKTNLQLPWSQPSQLLLPAA
jgi:hypothetical protein